MRLGCIARFGLCENLRWILKVDMMDGSGLFEGERGGLLRCCAVLVRMRCCSLGIRKDHILGAALLARRPSIKEAKKEKQNHVTEQQGRPKNPTHVFTHFSPNGGWGPPVFY